MKCYTILLIAIIFSSCNNSKLSSSDATNLKKIKATITIQNGTKKNSLDYIKVKLSDGKKQIINKNIKVLLNNTPLELFVRQGNYYDKYASYSTDDLVRKDSYYFEVILPDSTRHPLAFIKPINKNRVAKFSISKSVSVNDDFVLKWTNLNTPHQLDISKGLEIKKKRAANITEHTYHLRPTDTLKKRTGKYIVPKSYFTDSLTTINHLTVKITRKETGLTNPRFLKNSCITYYHIIEKTLAFKE
ncbi:MAG: hypothetical protein V3V28_02680 [Polaribacter sp.]|uniref:hypothetical protein n=1 Tax=Polaribacter sp. TaxID=1920175 RepID=UPI002F35EE74